MSQGIRQSQLFSGGDWQKIYRAFTSVNFNAYDYDTIRSSMVNYMRINFPEDFNDWSTSSEFVAIIDLLAYLGQSLAYRMDLNARENFIDTAERRESILRLAKLLSYNPRRNFPATGLVKVTQVICDENILDSNGINLANTPITWDDANNPDWFEQFILVLNASLVSTNPFGRPVNSGIIRSVKTQAYEFNNQNIARPVFSFSAVGGNEKLPFEIVNSNFDENVFYEIEPNPSSAFHILYRNDGNGNASPNTGFFLMFKQGQLRYEDFRLDVALENRVIDCDAESVNDTDVWVQEVDGNGAVVTSWIKVPNVVGNNIIYNSLSRDQRNIYSVITRDKDQVSVRFADGRFGNVPTGIFRVWYRQSSGTEYVIKPQDISGYQLSIPYYNSKGEIKNLGLQYALQYPVSNSQARESIDQIRRRAPQVYYTQDRMVNGEDYNVYPLNTNRAIKLTTINRTYAGHNRYFDLNDPTGKYQNTNIISQDGIIYREFANQYQEEPLPSAKGAAEITYDRIVPLVSSPELINFFYWYITTNDADGGTNDKLRPCINDMVVNSTSLVWQRAQRAIYSSTGIFGSNILNPTPVGSVAGDNNPASMIRVGAKLKFRDAGWVTVISVRGDGTYFNTGATPEGPGAITLDQSVASGDPVQIILPAYRAGFIDSELAAIGVQLSNNNTFGLRFDFLAQSWKIITAPNLNETGNYSIEYAGDTSFTNKDASWLIKVVYTPTSWQVTCRGMYYVFESEEDVRFFFVNRYKTVDLSTSRAVKDFVSVLKVNQIPHSTSAFGEDIRFELYDTFTYSDGYVEPRRVKIRPIDSDNDGQPDNPLAFDAVVFPGRFMNAADTSLTPSPYQEQHTWDILVFWVKYTDADGYEYYRPLTKNDGVWNYDTIASGDLLQGRVLYSPLTMKFYDIVADGVKPTVPVSDTTKYAVRVGRGLCLNRSGEHEGITFQWRHYAPYDQRIDPAPSNFMDMYVLTRQYYQSVQDWLSGSRLTTFPLPPTSDDLRQEFVDLASTKMASDEIIYHPVKFKLLFGDGAANELRASFKVVKLPYSTLSDGEIKSKVIRLIDEFFAIDNWDFGESFYFTELGTHIQMNMMMDIASIVLVPMNEHAKFGSLFEIKCESDEIFLSTASVVDIQIISTNTQTALRIGN